MAGMTTVLTEFFNNGNSRTSVLSGHSALAPKLVIEKRRVPENGQSVAEYSFKVVRSTTDAESLTLKEKVSLEAVARYPVAGQTTDIDAVIADFRSIVAGDEFANSIKTQVFL